MEFIQKLEYHESWIIFFLLIILNIYHDCFNENINIPVKETAQGNRTKPMPKPGSNNLYMKLNNSQLIR